MKTEFFVHKNYVEGILTLKGETVSWCKVDIQEKTWTVSDWKTLPEYQHKGYGKQILEFTLTKMAETFPIPDKIEYIWNGQNQYVYDWLVRHFDAVNQCPLAVKKYSSADDWESHIYNLNTEKFLNYFLKSA